MGFNPERNATIYDLDILPRAMDREDPTWSEELQTCKTGKEKRKKKKRRIKVIKSKERESIKGIERERKRKLTDVIRCDCARKSISSAEGFDWQESILYSVLCTVEDNLTYFTTLSWGL